MKILVTGGNGFLGSHIVTHFADQHHTVINVARSQSGLVYRADVKSVTMNLPDPALIDLLRQQTPEILIHAAGTAMVGQSLQSPLQDFEQSVRTCVHLLDSVRRSEIDCKIILLSSAAVYGDPIQLPIREDQRCAPISPYGYHKRMCEELAEYYWRLYKLSITSLRIFSAYGPQLRRQVIWDICQKALHQPAIDLSGDGSDSRDFIYVADVAYAIEKVIQGSTFQAEIFNVASGISVSISELASYIVECLGTQNTITFSGKQRSGDPKFWQADITKLRALGFAPQSSLKQGLQIYTDWVRQELGKS